MSKSTLSSWQDVLANPTIELLEHPIQPHLVSKHDIHEELGKILDQLDGSTMGDVVSTFYKQDPVNSSVLRFCDNDAKLDILDWAIEEDCLPPLGTSSPPTPHTTSDSEEDFEKELEAEIARVRLEEVTKKERAKQARTHAPKQKTRKPRAPILTQIAGRRKALGKMRDKLDQIVNERVYQHMLAKIAKAEASLHTLIEKKSGI